MSKITNDWVWHRMLYDCTHMATVGVKWLGWFVVVGFWGRHSDAGDGSSSSDSSSWSRCSSPSSQYSSSPVHTRHDHHSACGGRARDLLSPDYSSGTSSLRRAVIGASSEQRGYDPLSPRCLDESPISTPPVTDSVLPRSSTSRRRQQRRRRRAAKHSFTAASVESSTEPQLLSLRRLCDDYRTSCLQQNLTARRRSLERIMTSPVNKCITMVTLDDDTSSLSSWTACTPPPVSNTDDNCSRC